MICVCGVEGGAVCGYLGSWAASLCVIRGYEAWDAMARLTGCESAAVK